MRKMYALLIVLVSLLSSPAAAQDPRDLLDAAIANAQEARRLMGPPVVQVPSGGNLQAAIDTAKAGTIIQIKGSYTGPVKLRANGGVLASEPNTRAVITAPDSQSGVVVSGPNWTLANIDVTGKCQDCVVLAETATNVVLDGVYVHGDPTIGAKNGIVMNSAGATIRNSTIDDIFRVGQETHGIVSWNGPGPYLIENSFIRAASVNILVGGSDPSVANLVPSDIVVRNTTLTKRPEWKGLGYNVKNLFELKNARRVLVENNTLSYSWTDGQQGYAVGFSPRNQSGTCPWCTVEDVTFRHNVITGVGAGFNLLGTDDAHISLRMARILISDNDVTLCPSQFDGAARQVLIIDGPDNLELRNNRFSRCSTTEYINSFLYLAKASHQLAGFVVSGNRFLEGSYGLFGEGATMGNPAWLLYAPTGVWENNSVVDFPARNIPYPASTTYVPE